MERAIFFASPESSPSLTQIGAEPRGRYDVVTLPPFVAWALIWIRDDRIE